MRSRFEWNEPGKRHTGIFANDLISKVFFRIISTLIAINSAGFYNFKLH
jgi:hypothetical protein